MDNPKIDISGNKCWYNDEGRLHRVDGSAVEWANGSKEWCINGERHREDGPAVELSGSTKYLYINGKRHREDGPAIEYTDSDKSWWYNGKFIGASWDGFMQEDFERYLKIKEYW